MYPLDSPFRGVDEDVTASRLSKKTPFQRLSGQFLTKSDDLSFKPLPTSPAAPSTPKSASNRSSVVELAPETNIDLTYAYEQYVKGTSEEAQTLINLSSVIERNILGQLTAFIKLHEPQVLKILRDLSSILEDYEQTYKKVEDLKLQYDNYLRLNEITSDPKKEAEPEIEPAKEVEVDLTSSLIDSNEATLPSESPEQTLESEFDFPVKIGTITITEPQDFSRLLKGMMESITTVKRKIPIPGYKNQIFSSNQICNWLVRYRPFGIDPSRMNMEKFGQSLIDLKLLVGTGFFAKKFNSENMWFEWSDMAVFIAEYDSKKPSPAPEEHQMSSNSRVPSQKLSKLAIDEQTTKFMNDTSKKFNGMFQTMKTTFLKNDYANLLEEVESKYNDAYVDLQELRHLLEYEIFIRTQSLEKFEKLRIEIIYQSFTKLLEISYNFSLTSTTRLHKQATEFIQNINKAEIYEKDFSKMVEHYSTGIYFPTTIAPAVLSKQHYSTNQSNNNFQNIKHQFNLYKDISLQVLHEPSPLLSLASIPEILFKSIKFSEEKATSDSDIEDAWTAPINYQKYWQIKEDLIEEINTYTPSETVDVTKESMVHREILLKVTAFLESKDLLDIINFIKNWLLEISDSLIPCMIYDSLLNIYKSPSPERRTELTKHLSTIPRSNLSSLVYLLEHLSASFALDVIPTYQESDDSPNTVSNKSESKIPGVVEKLNSMDQIGGIPLMHIISRPPAAKNAKGFKPPLATYNSILTDLLNVEVRSVLLENLITSERNYLSKKEKEKSNFGILKKTAPADTTVEIQEAEKTPEKVKTPVLELANLTVNGATPKSPKPLAGDNFSLRPFRTGTTPRPSPNSSPRHTPKNSVDKGSEIMVKKLRDANGNRNRSGSSTFLAPSMSVQFEE